MGFCEASTRPRIAKAASALVSGGGDFNADHSDTRVSSVPLAALLRTLFFTVSGVRGLASRYNGME